MDNVWCQPRCAFARITTDNGPGFTLIFNGEAAAGDTIHLSTLTGAASGMRFLLDKPQQLAAASGFLVTANADNLSDADIAVDLVPIAFKTALPRLDKFCKIHLHQ